jgi:peptide/nickel transport system substrate-binding protein
MKKRILVVGLLLAAFLIFGCTPQTPATSKDSLVVAVPQDPDFLDPHKAEAAGTKEIMYNVFEGLLKPSPDGKPVEAIASAYTVSDDGLQYTFTLREGVTFHNGKEVTPEDVIWSYSRIAGAGEDAQESGVMIVAALVGTKMEKVGENQVLFTLSEPKGDFLEAMTSAVLDSSLEEASHNVEPVGTGPYKFVSYNPTQSIKLTRFDEYWNKEKMGKVKDVEFRLFSDNATALSSLLAGEVDLLPRITMDQIDSLPDTFEVFEGPQNMIQILGLNHAFPAFSKQEVREAINYAIDKDALISRVADGKAAKLGSNMSPVMEFWYHDGLDDPYPHNVDKAKELLAAAGESDLSFTISVPSNYEFHVHTAEVLAEQLAKAGITVKIEQVEWGIWLERIYFGEEYEATVISFVGKLDPHPMMQRYMSTYPQNFLNYESSEYDRLMEEGLRATAAADRAVAYKAAQEVIAKDSGVIFLMDPSLMTAHKKNLKGYTLYPIYFQDVSTLYFE